MVLLTWSLGLNNAAYVCSPSLHLTHCSLETLKGYLAYSADPDQMLQNVAPDQDIHCLQVVQPFFSQNI